MAATTRPPNPDQVTFFDLLNRSELPPLRPPRKPTEGDARDAALALLKEHRAELIAKARSVATEIALASGTVTSTAVFEEMRKRGYGDAMARVDPRWMGVVFQKGWERAGWDSSGSHKRPVAIWKISTDSETSTETKGTTEP